MPSGSRGCIFNASTRLEGNNGNDTNVGNSMAIRIRDSCGQLDVEDGTSIE